MGRRDRVDNLIIEKGSFGANPSPKDLARHLFTRMSCGQVVIIAENPEVTKAVLRKQWLKLARKVQRERSSTLNATRLLRLGDMVSKMQNMRFTTDWSDGYRADVCIAKVEQLTEWLPNCRTMYIICDIGLEQMQTMMAMMPVGSIVVVLNPKT